MRSRAILGLSDSVWYIMADFDGNRNYYEEVYTEQAEGAFPFDPDRYQAWLATAPRIDNGTRVLDIGCGVGFVCELLAQRGASVVGIDISNTALRLAQRRVPHGHFMASAHDGLLDLDTNHFDLVTCLGVLEHTEHPQTLVNEMARVLKADGRAIVVVPNSRSPYFWLAGGTGQLHEAPRTLRSWKDMFEASDLKMIGVKRDPGPSRMPEDSLQRRFKCGVNKLMNLFPFQLTYQYVFTLEPKAIANRLGTRKAPRT